MRGFVWAMALAAKANANADIRANNRVRTKKSS
jgi:hypothetical protein